MKSPSLQLSPRTLPGYLESLGLIEKSEPIRMTELGGGVSNIVLLVEFRDRRWVVKQALGKLRVKEEWLSDQARVIREAEAIRALRPLLGDSAVPEMIHLDRDNLLFIMSAAPADAIPWKESLLGRRADLAVAHQAGVLLARLINTSGAQPRFQQQFADRNIFEQLRIDPYYRSTAAKHPDVQMELRELIADSWNIQTALVHGDYSPKNMLVRGREIFLIDFEVVHWGDPSFDAGFLLSHLFLKAFHQPQASEVYYDAAREFWSTLRTRLASEDGVKFEDMALRHLGALLLARIDGKSPVEYIQDEKTKAAIRRFAKQIIRERPPHVQQVIGLAQLELSRN